jgi:hypothetical protein
MAVQELTLAAAHASPQTTALLRHLLHQQHAALLPSSKRSARIPLPATHAVYACMHRDMQQSTRDLLPRLACPTTMQETSDLSTPDDQTSTNTATAISSDCCKRQPAQACTPHQTPDHWPTAQGWAHPLSKVTHTHSPAAQRQAARSRTGGPALLHACHLPCCCVTAAAD